MLRFHGIDVSIRVKYTEKIVRAYRDDELQKLFAVADPEEHLLFSFFLATGAREQEFSTRRGVMSILRTASSRLGTTWSSGSCLKTERCGKSRCPPNW